MPDTGPLHAQATRLCPNGHPVSATAKFCPECGQAVPQIDPEKELERHLEDQEPGWLAELLAQQARRAPWWAISALVHIIALLLMWQWPYRPVREEVQNRPIEVSLAEERPDELFEAPEPFEELPPEEELEVPIEDIPPTAHRPSLKPPGPDFDLPAIDDPVTDDRRPIPSIDPPAATPVLTVRDSSRSHRRGIYSGRNSTGRANAIGGDGGTTYRAESAVDAGLLWLAKAQERDGRWNCKKWGGGDHDAGMTGLALLAFLGAGYTHLKGRYRATVLRGLRWLQADQKPDGRFGFRTFYEQGIAAMAVCEAYALTRSPKLGRMAQRAVGHICRVQPSHGGFRYKGPAPKGEGDLSVTGWQIMAIKSAIASGLDVPGHTVDRTRTFLRNSWRGYGKSCYIVGNKGPGGPAVWAIGMLGRQFIGGDYDTDIRQCADALLAHARSKDGGVGKGRGKLVGDLYYTYYSVLAMYQRGGDDWTQWNKLFRYRLVKAQTHALYSKGRYVRGSWNPANHVWGSRGGRVYSTAMAILSLEVYYRFLPVYRAGS